MKKILSTFLIFCLSILAVAGLVKVNAEVGVAPVRDGETYLGREYNKDFDRMFDNFERATMDAATEAGLWWASSESEVKATFTERTGVLHVEYSGASTTADASIYKAASNANSEGTYAYLVFKMKGTGSIKDLDLLFRYDDNHDLIRVSFDEILDPDGEVFPELSDEYHLYIVNIADTLDGLEYTRDGETTVPAGTQMAGFHLVSKEGKTGVVEIDEVYYTSNENTLGYNKDTDSLFDNFVDKTNPNEAASGVWWCGSVGEIIGNHLKMPATSTYKAASYDVSNATDTYKYMVIKARGEKGAETFSIKPFWVADGDKWGESIAYTSLVGPDETALPALGTSFTGLVIDLEKSGITPKNINGLEITSNNGTIYVDQIFFTNMEYDASEVCTDFPVLNTTDIVLFDDFNRDTLGVKSDYVANEPVAVANDLDYIISYAGMDRLSIVDGALVMDCTTNSDYLQLCEASTRYKNDGTYPYLVMKLKVTDGGTLENFRIKTSVEGTRSNDVWANGGLKSGKGFLVATELTENYRYTTEDGYMYMIVDLASSGLNTEFDGIDFFYSGSGKLWIDAVFFAKAGKESVDTSKAITFDDFNRTDVIHNDWWQDTNATVEGNALKLDATNNDYRYYRTARPTNNSDYNYQYLSITMKGTEGTTLNSFRFCVDEKPSDETTTYFVNQGNIILADGSVLTPEMLTTEYKEFIIDMAASKMTGYKAPGLSVHFGSWTDGIIYIDEIKYYASVDVNAKIEEKLISLAADKAKRPLDTPVVTIEGKVVTISAVLQAEKYEIYVDGELVTTTDELVVDLATFNIASGDHKVTVKAIATNKTSSESSEELSFTVEAAPSGQQSSGCFGTVIVMTVMSAFVAVSAAGILLRKKH